MSDDVLRSLERRFRASGDPGDELAWLRERARLGGLQRESLRWAAAIGHPPAQEALGERALELQRLLPLVRGLGARLSSDAARLELARAIVAGLAAGLGDAFTTSVRLPPPPPDASWRPSPFAGTGADPRRGWSRERIVEEVDASDGQRALLLVAEVLGDLLRRYAERPLLIWVRRWLKHAALGGPAPTPPTFVRRDVAPAPAPPPARIVEPRPAPPPPPRGISDRGFTGGGRVDGIEGSWD